ncbi:MAG: diguanylate cyclase domain-containing protein [Acidimicrobiia bacterium]
MPAPDTDLAPLVADHIVSLARRAPHLFGVADGAGRLVWLNAAGHRFLGTDDATALTTADLFTEEVFDRYYATIRPALVRHGVWSGELPVKRAGGTGGVVDAVLVAGVEGDEVRWLACLAVDVTERDERERALSHQASHDPLTGLPNRALLADRLSIAVSVAERTGSAVVVLALDLDGFKDVNDRLGHAVGDQLLQQVTARIEAAVRPADTVARLGGDEFVVVLHPPDEPAAAMAVAERIREQVGLVDYVIGEHHVRITASVGFTMSQPGVHAEPQSLLAAADRGMYRAKRSGGNCVRIAGSDEPGVVDPLDRVGDELARSLAEGRITAAFDPVLRLADGQVCAAQVVARWEHPLQGTLAPQDFAEEAVLTGYADLVWWTATRRALRVAEDAGFSLPLHVPLSTSQLRDPELRSRLRSLRRLAPTVDLHLKVDGHSLLELATTGGELIDTFVAESLPVVLAGHGEVNLPPAILAALPLSAIELGPHFVGSALELRAIGLATQTAWALDVSCIAPLADDSRLDQLHGLGVNSVRGPAVGEGWSIDRLAVEARRRATRPRP